MSPSLADIGSVAQIALALGALTYSIVTLWEARSSHAALRRKLLQMQASPAEVQAFLEALSRAESDGVNAMRMVLGNQSFLVCQAIASLAGRKRKAVEKALTQPSDRARKLYLTAGAAEA